MSKITNYYKVIGRGKKTTLDDIFPFGPNTEGIAYEAAAKRVKELARAIICQWKAGPRVGVPIVGLTERGMRSNGSFGLNGALYDEYS